MSAAKLIILRPKGEAEASARYFCDHGVDAVALPATEIADLLPAADFPLMPEEAQLSELDGALFTSPRAVDAFFRQASGGNAVAEALLKAFQSPDFPIGAVAERTGEAIKAAFAREASFFAKKANQQSLGEAIRAQVEADRLKTGANLLFPCARGAARTMEEMGQYSDFNVIRAELYESRPAASFSEELMRTLKNVDPIFALYAPSQAEALNEAIRSVPIPRLKQNLKLLCIGPTTARAALALWPNADITIAASPDDPAMLQTIRTTEWLIQS